MRGSRKCFALVGNVSSCFVVRPVEQRGRFLAADALRACAALSVLVYHAALFTEPGFLEGQGPFTTEFGLVPGTILQQAGLVLYVFFVLSGYLIARPFVRSIVFDEPLPRLGAYLRNRSLRILPAFWCVFTVTLVIAGISGRPLGDIAAVYGFLQAVFPSPTSALIGPAWTLGAEVSFYLLVPVAAAVAVIVIRRLPAGIARQLAIAAASLGIFVVSARVAFAGDYLRTIPGLLYAFIPGVLLAVAEPYSALGRQASKPSRLVSAGCAVVFVFGVAMVLKPPVVPGANAIGAAAIVGAPLVLQWSSGSTWRWARSGALPWLGRRSYSLYLVHWGVLLLIREAVPPGRPLATFALYLCACLPLAIGIAALSYEFVEKPFLRRRAPWRRPSAQPAPKPQQALPSRPGGVLAPRYPLVVRQVDVHVPASWSGMLQ